MGAERERESHAVETHLGILTIPYGWPNYDYVKQGMCLHINQIRFTRSSVQVERQIEDRIS